MKKIFTSICAILACEHLLSNDGKITLEDAQLESIETAISQDKQTISDLQAQVQTLTSEKQQLTTEKQQLVTEKQTLSDANTQLQNEVNTLKQKPAESTAHVVNDKHDQQVDKTDAELYLESCANAQSLFNELP